MYTFEMKVFRDFYIFLTAISVTLAVDLFVGDECYQLNGNIGVCRLARNCPFALNNTKLLYNGGFYRCGFLNLDEIICCPDITTEKRIDVTPDNSGNIQPVTIATYVSSNRKAYKECKKLEENAPINLEVTILNGESARDNEFPHMAALGYLKPTGLSFDCGGTLISKRYVLTAAHCIINKEIIKPTKVRLGINWLSEGNENEDYNIETDIVHPQYNRSLKYNDIALLRLDKDVQFHYKIYPACLYTDLNDLSGDFIITGWGNTNINKARKSDNLLKANVTWVDFDSCKTAYIGRLNKSLPIGIIRQQMCAIDEKKDQDSCQGDSGGPIQISNKVENMFTVVGITSFGISCGIGIPGVYTKVAWYLDWIESVVWSD